MEKAESIKIRQSTLSKLKTLKEETDKSLKLLMDEAVDLLLLKRRVEKDLQPSDEQILIEMIKRSILKNKD